MKVAVWAEIRRLHEVERLSQAAIARRLHCHHRTVRKALSMESPPPPTPGPRESILDPYRTQIDALVAKYPDLSAVRVMAAISQALQYQTYDAAYVEALLLQERRRRELSSPTPLQPKRRELIEDIHLEEPDPARYDRLCGDCEPEPEEPQA